MMTIAARFADAARVWPERPIFRVIEETAAVYGIPEGVITYREASAEVARIRESFATAGYPPRSRVMLRLENRPAFFLHLIALNGMGISVVPLNPDLRRAEMAHLVMHSKPGLVVVAPGRLADLVDAVAYSGALVPVVELGQMLPPCGQNLSVTRFEEDPAHQEAALLYTSGSTGVPKGCVLSNEYFTMAGDWYASLGGIASLSRDGERMVTPLPTFHMNAMAYSFMAMLTVGGCLTCLDRFHPRTWWDSVRVADATCFHYLGVMPSMLMGLPASSQDTLHGLRFGFGAGVDARVQEPFETRFAVPLVEAWAMTETGAGAVVAAADEPRVVGEHAFGRPGEGVEIRVMAADGNDASEGELLVRRAGVNHRRGFFTEYLDDSEATCLAWEGGWFHTGDIVRRSEDGMLHFVDRSKNVIRRSGENIAAVEVEGVLMRHPAVINAGVTAVPDDIRGQEVFACIQLDGQSNQAMAEELTNWCLDDLSYFKAPGYVAFVDSLPLTATQKIQRHKLRELAVDLMDDRGTVSTIHLKRRVGS